MNYEDKIKKISAADCLKKTKVSSKRTENLRLNPQQRLCSAFDEKSLAEYPVADKDEMGFRVVDNCAQENIK